MVNGKEKLKARESKEVIKAQPDEQNPEKKKRR
jgi:hypothetical protein